VVEQKYADFEQSLAYATSFLLAFAAVLCLIVVSLIRPKESRS
jgi:sulfate/thiosulfate transport system permease protein